MAYIGKQPVAGNFVKLDAITTSATATYNLLNGGVAYFPQSANNCIVSLNGIIQEPTSSGNVGGYTISGSTIVFTSALTSLDVIDFIMVLGDVLSVGTPSDNTITTAKLASGLVVPVGKGGTGLTALGTASQVLKVNSGATALEFGTVSGGIVQTVFSQTSTRFSSTSDSYVATPLTITITPTSASNSIILFLRTLINVTGDTYPRFKWFRSIGGGAFSSIITEATNSNGGSSLGAYLTDRANLSNVYQMNVMSDFYKDSPNTTSAVTYTLYGVRENAGTFYINTSEHNEGGNTNDYNQVGTSNLMAFETAV
jgi:hypothetical protein